MILPLLACSLLFQQGSPTTPVGKPPKTPAPPKPDFQFTDKPTGYGRPVKAGEVVVIQFLVKKANGDLIADSKRRGLHYIFKLGEPGNDPLLDLVVKGMKPGATRTGIVMGRDAYGPEGAPPFIAPNERLTVVVTLLRRGEK